MYKFVCHCYRVTASEDSAGDDMDTIARHVRHSYDLRSLHRGTGGGNIDNSNTGQYCYT